MVVLKSNFT